MAYFEKGKIVLMNGSIHHWTIIRIVGDELLLSRKKRKHGKHVIETRWCPKEWASVVGDER